MSATPNTSLLHKVIDVTTPLIQKYKDDKQKEREAREAKRIADDEQRDREIKQHNADLDQLKQLLISDTLTPIAQAIVTDVLENEDSFSGYVIKEVSKTVSETGVMTPCVKIFQVVETGHDEYGLIEKRLDVDNFPVKTTFSHTTELINTLVKNTTLHKNINDTIQSHVEINGVSHSESAVSQTTGTEFEVKVMIYGKGTHMTKGYMGVTATVTIKS